MRHGGESPLTDRMIFLVGARRSGTNWLFQLLTLHPEIVGIEAETYLFALGVAPLAERIHHGAPASHQTGAIYMEREEFHAALRRFVDEVYLGVAERLDHRASRIVDRSPGHANHLDLIRDVYPDSWTVHIIRDGRDVAGSLVGQGWGPRTMTEAAGEWVQAIRDARAHPPPRYREVRYEELIRDPVAQMVDLFDWLGLDCNDELRAQIAVAARIPVNKSEADAIVTEGKHRGGLTVSEAVEFDVVAGELLRELGYPDIPSSDTGSPPRWRRLAQHVAGPVRRRTGRRFDDALPAAVVSDYWLAARTGDRIIDIYESDEPERIADLIPDDAIVRLVVPEGALTDRGPRGASLLLEEWRSTRELRRQQIRADVHIQGDGLTICFTHASTDESLTDSFVVAKLRVHNGEAQLSAIAYYRAPLPPGESP